MKKRTFSSSFPFTGFNLHLQIISLITIFILITGLSSVAASNVPHESLYLHTNGDTFFSGDTLWFKAYNLETESLTPSSLSQFLNVSLLTANGDLILHQRHQFDDGLTDGDLIIPDSLPPGSYLLTAYSNFAALNDPGNIFHKHIKLLTENEIHLKVTLEDSLYSIRDEITGSIEALGNYQSRLGNVKVLLQLMQDGIGIKNTNIRIGEEGTENFSLKIPELTSNKALLLKATLEHSQLYGSSSTYIPFKEIPPSIQFFPEGGEVISNFSSTIAFKALDALGNPFDFSGEIIRPDGTVVSTISSQFFGMGKFNLGYRASDSLSLKILYSKGYDQLYSLPVPTDHGYSLNILESTDDQVRVVVNSNFGKSGENVKVIVQIRGEEYFAKTLKLSELKNYSIPTEGFPIGVAQITILDEKEIPRAERLVFVNQNKKLNIKIDGQKPEYKTKDKVDLKVEVTDQNGKPAPALLSVSVVKFDSDYSSNLKHNLMSTLLLKSDLKGEIIYPGFYFSDQLGSKQALDLLMLTQGWRKFEISKDETLPDENFQTSGLSGRVVKQNGRPAKNADMVLFNSETLQTTNTKTDLEGRFSFNGYEFSELANSDKLILSATGPGGNTNLKILLDPDFENKTIPNTNFIDLKVEAFKNYHLATQKETDIDTPGEQNYHRYTDFTKGIIPLEGVTITARKKVILPEEVYTKTFASHKVSGDELDYLGPSTSNESFLEMLKKVAGSFHADKNHGYILFRGHNNIYNNRQQGAAIVVDEKLIGFDFNDIVDINPDEMESLEVFKSAAAAMKYTPYGQGGLIKITMKKGFSKKEITDLNNQKASNIETIPGFKVSRQFYSPVYTSDEQKQEQIDLRKTIFWEPYLMIGRSGKASIDFFNSDEQGNFLIQLEGNNPVGQLGFVSKKYIVNK